MNDKPSITLATTNTTTTDLLGEPTERELDGLRARRLDRWLGELASQLTGADEVRAAAVEHVDRMSVAEREWILLELLDYQLGQALADAVPTPPARRCAS